MKVPFNIFRSSILDTIPADDILARQRYALFRIYSFLGVVLMMVFAIEELSFDQLQASRITTFISVSALLLINYLMLRWHKNLTIAYTISIIAGLTLIHFATYNSGGIRNPDFFYMGSIVLYSYVILENKGGRLTMFLSLANIIYFYIITDFTEPGELISYELSESAIDTKHLYTAVISMVIITSLTSFLAYAKNAVINRIVESKVILTRKNEELKELSLVASETVNSVIITDKNGIVEWVNEGFTRLTGYLPEEVTGQKPSFLFGPKSDPVVANNLQERNFPTNTFSAEIIKYKKSGDMVWVQENVTRIMDEEEQAVKYIYIESDISERKKSEERMSEYLRNLVKTNKELDKFAYVVSHDLKAPLRAIGNLTGWIEEDAGHLLPGEVRQNFNLIKERVIRMEALINGILDYSKAAKKNNQTEIFDLNELVKESIEFLGKNDDCRFTINTSLPSLNADKIKVQQVFMNLIGNAIKFNNKKIKEISISCEEHPAHYHFSITDNGPGIDPRFHERIFVIFQTINTRDEFESTGVGLAIVKKIVEEHNGKIWIDSRPGKGSTFHFTWPKTLLPSERTNTYNHAY